MPMANYNIYYPNIWSAILGITIVSTLGTNHILSDRELIKELGLNVVYQFGEVISIYMIGN